VVQPEALGLDVAQGLVVWQRGEEVDGVVLDDLRVLF